MCACACMCVRGACFSVCIGAESTWGQCVCLVSTHLALAGIGLRFWVDWPLAEPRHCLQLIWFLQVRLPSRLQNTLYLFPCRTWATRKLTLRMKGWHVDTDAHTYTHPFRRVCRLSEPRWMLAEQVWVVICVCSSGQEIQIGMSLVLML